MLVIDGKMDLHPRNLCFSYAHGEKLNTRLHEAVELPATLSRSTTDVQVKMYPDGISRSIVTILGRMDIEVGGKHWTSG